MIKDKKARSQKGKILSFVPTGEYYFTKGIKVYHRRDFKKAKKYLQRAMQLEPGEPMITCQLAIVLTELGEYENSNRLLHIVLNELDQDMSECHYFLANNYAHMGFFKDAYHHANMYLTLEPNGDFREDTEELLEILMLETDGLEEPPYEQDDLILKQEQARELLESGYFPKAIELLKDVVEEYPEYWSAYNNLALAYFYLGKTKKAESILDDVLDRNPGNLHALCNRMVFAHYQGKKKVVAQLTESLKKIQPILIEHQYKLGATFAMVGEYQAAYYWLKKLYNIRFDGDGPFYYWLAYSAYYSGYVEFAETIWKIALEHSPDKKGMEPWVLKRPINSEFEDHSGSIYQKLESDFIEERLFAIFLASITGKAGEILISERFYENQKLTTIEKNYASYLKTGTPSELKAAQEIAELLYKNHNPFETVESGLFLKWFSVFVEISKTGMNLNNRHAWAGAIEYVWYKESNEKVSQQEVATTYDISPATIGKYVKLLNDYMCPAPLFAD
ncbi:tetratricopeptide repeat protein [Neobacillus vireti]|uniref:tetratricopeptide repeat protein n=1 Tax=Neobacillus vireti TaxID=220686 RepID=UPI002FFE81EA